MSTMHNNRNADCRQRHLYRWPGGNRNQEIRREAFRRQSPHSKPTQGVDAVPRSIIWCLLHLCHFLHATGFLLGAASGELSTSAMKGTAAKILVP